MVSILAKELKYKTLPMVVEFENSLISVFTPVGVSADYLFRFRFRTIQDDHIRYSFSR
jgi:hypothetical protein